VVRTDRHADGHSRRVPNLMMSWSHAAELAAVLAAAGIGLRFARAQRARAMSAFAIEAGIVAGLYTVWQLAGNLSVMGSSDALARAAWIARLEHTLALPSERGVQNLIIHHGLIVQAANLYYASMHFGVLFVFLLWLFARHRSEYGAVRTTLALSTLGCLAISFIPVAPPRVLGEGIVDTAMLYGQSVYGGQLSADQLAAMPSVHVLWAVTIAWYAIKIGRSRWRFITLAHALVTVFVVVATGNHWWLDGIVAIAVLVVCAWMRVGLASAWAASRRAGAAQPAVPETALADDHPAGVSPVSGSRPVRQ
jgi:hypothetical protein